MKPLTIKIVPNNITATMSENYIKGNNIPLIHITGIGVTWNIFRYKELLEKKGLRLYLAIRLMNKEHQKTIEEQSTLTYLFNHIL